MDFKSQSKLKAVTFSYDDGVTQDIRLIELLNKYGLKCTFNLNSERLGCKGMLLRNGLRIAHYKIHPADVRAVYDGHEIAAHSLTHPTLVDLEDDREIIRQIEQDRLNLSELAGYEVVGMAYPNKPGDRRTAELIRNHTGIRYARSTPLTDSFDPREDPYLYSPNLYHMDFDRMMEMGRQFVELKADKPQILYIWGHSYEMDYLPDAWVKLEEFFKLVSGHKDIFYGTNKEILL